MAKQLFTFVFLASIIYCINGDEDYSLPPYITACKKTDPNLDDCVKTQIIKSMNNVKQGIASLGVKPLDPLHLSKPIVIKGNGLDLTLKDTIVYGLGDAKIKKVIFNVKKGDFRLEFVTNIVLKANYEAKGQLLFVAIEGKGPAIVKADDTNIDISCKFSLEKTPKGEFYKMHTPTFKYAIKKAHFDLQNLFNGKQPLAQHAQDFMNEKSDIIMADVAPPAIDQIVTEAVNTVKTIFDKVPANKILLE